MIQLLFEGELFYKQTAAFWDSHQFSLSWWGNWLNREGKKVAHSYPYFRLQIRLRACQDLFILGHTSQIVFCPCPEKLPPCFFLHSKVRKESSEFSLTLSWKKISRTHFMQTFLCLSDFVWLTFFVQKLKTPLSSHFMAVCKGAGLFFVHWFHELIFFSNSTPDRKLNNIKCILCQVFPRYL